MHRKCPPLPFVLAGNFRQEIIVKKAALARADVLCIKQSLATLVFLHPRHREGWTSCL